MMGWGYGMSPWGWLIMTGSWLLLIAVIIAAVIWLLPRGGGPRAGRPGGTDPARAVLDQRLARGEIDVETYRTLRDELSGNHRAPR
jgi:putative membrane protein